ncbi:hypothetical protein NX871_27725 [Burkholderia thailandensis]|nr:hypothetical protein [Burkholderia thailandensis]MCS6473703.1 hypothetical protein [Burkholderia thailandensis]
MEAAIAVVQRRMTEVRPHRTIDDRPLLCFAEADVAVISNLILDRLSG